jgi:hypothetical protein
VAKRFTGSARIGEAGMALIGMLVAEMGFIWHPRRVDHGIDGEVELVSPDGAALNRVLLVQSKARSVASRVRTTTGFGGYPVLQARLYDALGPASGLALTVGALFPLNALVPLAIAGIAEQWGLAVALWPLLAAPLALRAFVPGRSQRRSR